MWGNLFQSLGNFVTGHGFQDNAARAREDARNRTTTTTTVGVRREPTQFRPTITPSINRITPTEITPTTPTVPQAKKPLSANPSGTPDFGIKQKYVYKGQDLTGLSAENAATAKRVIDKARPGVNLKPVVSSFRQAQDSKAKADYENSVPGKVLNTAGGVGRILGGMAGNIINFATRIPQTIDTAKDSFELDVVDNLPGMQWKKQQDLAKARMTQLGYTNLQKHLSDITNTVGDGFVTSNNAETEREAQAISSGKGTPGDIFSGYMKSLDVAGMLPIGKALTTERMAAKELAPAAEDTAKSVGSRFWDFLTKERLAPGSKFNPEVGGKKLPDAPSIDVPTPTKAADDVVPPKPQNVVKLDKGGSISAPVRKEAAGLLEAPKQNFTMPERVGAKMGGDAVDLSKEYDIAYKNLVDTVGNDPQKLSLETEKLDEIFRRKEQDLFNRTGDYAPQPAVSEVPPMAKTPETPIEQATKEAAANATVPVDANGQPFTAPLDNANFGDITQAAARNGMPPGQELSGYLEQRAAKAAADAGIDPEAVIAKLQKANASPAAKTYADTTLTEAERAWANAYQKEMSFLLDRANVGEHIGFQKFYSPQQRPGTEFTPELVNNLKRTGKIPVDELDNSLTPFNQYIRRYSDAGKSITDDIVDTIEYIPDATSETGFRPSGIKVPEEVKGELKQLADDYVKVFDERLGADGPAIFNELDASVSDAADAIVVRALKSLEGQPRTPEVNAVINELSKGRGSYVHTYIEANLLGQIGGRVADQVNKGIVGAMDKTIGRAVGGATEKWTGVAMGPKTKVGKQIAKEWSSGSNRANIVKEFKTNRRLLSAKAKTPFGKASATWRAGTTGLVRFADLGTSNARKAIGYFVREAEDSGLKTADEITAYVTRKIASPEYKDMISGVESVTNQNIALSTNRNFSNLQSNNFWMHDLGKAIDSWPRVLTNKLRSKYPDMSPKVDAVINSGISRFLTGFARVTTTAASKGVDVVAAGIPTMKRGFSALKFAETPAERMAAAQTVRQGIIEAASVGGFAGIGVAMSQFYTGNYPTDKSERARWEREGIEANTFRIPIGGNSFISIEPGRLGAFSLPIVLAASVASGKMGNPVETVSGVSQQFAKNFGLDQIGGIFTTAGDLLSGGTDAALKEFKQVASSIAAGLIPASGLINEAGNVIDRTARDTSSALGTFMNKTPLRFALPEKTDVFGNPLQNTNVGMGSWLTGSHVDSDPVSQEINRLSDAKFEVMPANDVKNENAQKDAALMMNSEMYKNADDKTKADLLHQTLLGTKLKDVSTSLPDEQRIALIQHTLLGEAKRPIWLENNDNALNYYTALVENKRVSGTLTAADKDMEKTGSLAQKVAIAGVNKKFNVSQDIILGYADTSKSEFNDMADGPEKQALQAYDKALFDAGLPSKYQNKYGGYGKAGSGRVKGMGSFSFMKPMVPGEANTIKSQNLSVPGDPFAGLVKAAPATKTNLKRSISVNKGVHL